MGKYHIDIINVKAWNIKFSQYDTTEIQYCWNTISNLVNQMLLLKKHINKLLNTILSYSNDVAWKIPNNNIINKDSDQMKEYKKFTKNTKTNQIKDL